MASKARICLFLAAAGLAGSTFTTVALAATVKAGTACTKAGARFGSGTKALLCVKTAKGLRWTAAATTTTTRVPATKPPTGETTSTTSAKPSTTTAASTPKAPSALRTGSLRGVAPYAAAGGVELATSSGSGVIRIRGSAIQSGPTLAVYLTPTAGATSLAGALRIGPLSSLTGDHDYDIPAGTDPSAYAGVLIWCDRFTVPFGVAELR